MIQINILRIVYIKNSFKTISWMKEKNKYKNNFKYYYIFIIYTLTYFYIILY